MTATRVIAARGTVGALAAIAARMAALSGWRRCGLAALLGVLATVALPPADATPLIVPAFTGLVWLYDGVEGRRAAFVLGWWFGFGFFLVGLYWIGIAMLVDAAQFGWMVPFATAGLSAGLAVFPGLALWLLRLSRTAGPGRVFALAVSWTVLEWLRGHVLTGFPWNLIGYTWTLADAPIQFAALVGIYGLSLVTVLIAALPAAAGGPGVAGRRWLPLGVAVALVAALWGGGALRLAAAGEAMVPGVKLRLVQADIAERLKWQPEQLAENLQVHIRLSEDGDAAHVSDIIWPEAAEPYFLAEEPGLRAALARLAPKGGLLLTGTLRRAPAEGIATPEGAAYRYYNSLEALDDVGRIVGTYDKFHLVPFGEYVPLRGILPVERLAPGRGDFSAGPGPRTLELPGLPPVSPLICYEAIFPGEVTDPAHPPQWLLNVTNDAWFGTSSGPYQHFESARLRAVEEGIPLVRAANTGISGVVDAYGRVIARLGLGKRGIVDAPLPAAIPGGTPFAHFGQMGLILLLALAATLAWGLSRIP